MGGRGAVTGFFGVVVSVPFHLLLEVRIAGVHPFGAAIGQVVYLDPPPLQRVVDPLPLAHPQPFVLVVAVVRPYYPAVFSAVRARAHRPIPHVRCRRGVVLPRLTFLLPLLF